jgi:hypothetical protein
VVTRWHPNLDLARLFEALSEEVLAATDDEVRASAGPGRKLASAAREVRWLIKAACADADEELDRSLKSSGLDKDPDDNPIEPGAGPRPAGTPRRPSHHQRH